MVFKPKVKAQELEEEEFEVPQPQYKEQKINRQQVQEVKEWSVEEVVTQTQPLIYNNRTKKEYTILEAIAEILNRSE